MFRDVGYLATDNTLLIAIPAFAPALVIAGVVIFVALRNRSEAPEGVDGVLESETPSPPA